MASEDTLHKDLHVKFLLRHLQLMPTDGLDSNRMTLVYFVVSSLDVLGEMDKLNADAKQHIKDFIHSCQILPDHNNPEDTSKCCGFRGSTFFGNKFNPNCDPLTVLDYANILGDDMSKINKQAIVKGLKTLQQDDGSFSCAPGGSESDMRFVYCACAISHMLDDWSGIDTEKAYNFIISSQAYDGGIAQGPYQESHGGSTYCAVQALHLLSKLGQLPRKKQLVQWCLERQQTGFQGRIGKVPDTCYSFWIGAALHTLGAHGYTQFSAIKGHSFSCQHQRIGGFSKCPENHPDILHTLCGLALGGLEGLSHLDCAIGCTVRASGNWYKPPLM